MRVYKYPLEIVDEQQLSLPAGAELLSVQMQGDKCCLWALVDEIAPTYLRTIVIHGTGHHLEKHPGKYISTFQMHGGQLVFHAFVRNEGDVK